MRIQTFSKPFTHSFSYIAIDVLSNSLTCTSELYKGNTKHRATSRVIVPVGGGSGGGGSGGGGSGGGSGSMVVRASGIPTTPLIFDGLILGVASSSV